MEQMEHLQKIEIGSTTNENNNLTLEGQTDV